MITTLTALAEPNRFRIVELQREGPKSVNEIVARLGLSQPLVSKHLGVLKSSHLVQAQTKAQQRIYALEGAGFQELDAWLDTFAALWTDRLDTFDDYLQTMKAEKHAQGDQP